MPDVSSLDKVWPQSGPAHHAPAATRWLIKGPTPLLPFGAS
jgi:hypothetical protein